jgi:hypothetical protein
MNVLIIPEDFRKDQYVLKPIISEMLKATGISRAEVRLCLQPLLGGISQCLDWGRISEILDRYSGMVDLFLLCVDRDGQAGRKDALTRLEELAAGLLPAGKRLLGENAWQEIEVWVLAGHDLPSGWSWRSIREEVNPKEVYFEPFAKQRGVHQSPGGGRKTLAEQAARRYDRVRQLCPEDIAAMEDRIRGWLQGMR